LVGIDGDAVEVIHAFSIAWAEEMEKTANSVPASTDPRW
jgi:hypothetical protein